MPFSVEKLLARLRVNQHRLAIIGADAEANSSVFVNGRLKMDFATGCAYLGENELQLMPIEYKLLCLMSKNIGKVLTHTYITKKSGATMSPHSVCLWQPCEKSSKPSLVRQSIFKPISAWDTRC